MLILFLRRRVEQAAAALSSVPAVEGAAAAAEGLGLWGGASHRRAYWWVGNSGGCQIMTK